MDSERETAIKLQLTDLEITPSERLGQHFLTDEGVMGILAGQVRTGSLVIEVGSGIGHVSVALAERASKLIGIELDKRFQLILENLQESNPKLFFIMGDILKVPLDQLIAQAEEGQEVQVIANLPYHITEPFMRRLIRLPVTGATLMLGDSAADEMQQEPQSLSFGRLSLLAQTFYDVRRVATVPRTCFFPIPRTDSAIMDFVPKERKEIDANPTNFIVAELFRREHQNGLVINVMKQALVDASSLGRHGTSNKETSHRRERADVREQMKAMARAFNRVGEFDMERGTKRGNRILSQADAIPIIREMGIPEDVLSNTFTRLDNQELRALALGLRNYYSHSIQRIGN